MNKIAPFSLLNLPAFELEKLRHQAAVLCHVRKSQIQDIYPCTALQEGLLALTAQDPGSYVAQFSYEIRSDVSTEQLQHAWQYVVASNPILRTRVVNIHGHGLLQVVVDEPLLWTTKVDIDDSSSEDTASNPMGLGTALTEMTLFSTSSGAQRHLQWDIHHALYDGWSFPLLLEGVERAYFGEPSQSLHPITHLIAHQLNQDEAATKAYWQSQFQDTQGAHFPPSNLLGLSPSTNNHVDTILPLPDNRSNFTMTTVIKATWSLVVASLTNKDEALFGLTVSGRQAPIDNIESIAGPTIATIPIRVTIDWNQTVSELLNSIQCQATDMIPFEQTGLQKIRRSSQDAALACNFQTLLVIQPAQEESPTSPSSRSLFVDDPLSRQEDNSAQNFQTYPLVIECHPSSTEVEVRFDFDSSAIAKEQVIAAATSLRNVFERLRDPSSMDAKLRSFVKQDEYYQGLERVWSWNAAVPESTEVCMHDMIRNNALRYPDACAIQSWDGEMTYKELEDTSARLAQHLLGLGVAETIVPLVFEKSRWMPVAVLAVLKTGSAPIALDISQPKSRLSAIISQSASPIILSSATARQLTLEISENREVVTIDREVDNIDPENVQLPDVNPGSTLYVVFTSGSTGVPKGVMITHANFASAITHQQAFVGFNTESRVLDFASYAFDVAWSNLFNTLTAGGCLCIPSTEERQNDLAGCIKRHRINFLDLTPSLARTIGNDALSQIDTMILGGEAAQPSDAFLAGKDTRVFNLYGPAECTPTITCSELTGKDVHIGHGAGVCTWIVDIERPDELAPLGAIGELWVEGPLVGQGYLNNPEQTVSAFVVDPPWLTAGIPTTLGRVARAGRQGRLYRTGDLVRYNADGSLAFVGRKDTQVKIRGQRIELAEIEQCTNQALDAIRDPSSPSFQIIVETIKPEGARNAVIIAFVCASRELRGVVDEQSHAQQVQKLVPAISSRLSEMLPSYMLPSSFVPIQELPITTNGKTDIKALRSIGEATWIQHRDTQMDAQATPEDLTENEKVLQQVWMSVLNLPVEMVSVNKAFMRMGGDSISAMQVVAECRLRSIFTTVADVLKSSTIRTLAASCQHSLDGATDVDSEEDPDDEAGTVFPLSPIQRNFFEAYEGGLNHYNQSFVLDFREEVSSETLHAATRILVERHPMLRARFRLRPGTDIHEQFVVSEAQTSFAYSEHYVTSYDGFGKAAQWRQESLDIFAGPVFAADVFHVPKHGKKLVLSAHHLVVDLVSWRIIWQEIEDFVDSGSLPLQPTTSFSKWCKRQARVASNASPLSVLPYTVPEPQFEFWDMKLDDNTWGGVESLEQTFDSSVTEQLFGIANDALRTEPTDIVLGALAASFAQVFPQRTLPAFWIEGHGREPLGDQIVDVSRTVGWFTTIYPLVLSLSSRSTTKHAVRLAKDVRLSVPGKGQPYFACRYHSQSGQETFGDHGSVVEIQFNFTGRFQQLEKDEGLFKEESDVDENSDFDMVEVSPASRRSAMIDITANVGGDSLSVTFEIHQQMKHRQALEQWTTLFGATLKSVVGSLAQSSPAPTASDLNLVSLSYDGLDTLLNESLPALGLHSAQVRDMYPCSPLQEGMLLSQAKQSASYATFQIWQCTSADSQNVCPQKLADAWRAVTKRHAALSAIFLPHPDGHGFIQVELYEPSVQINNIQTERESESPADKLISLDPPHFLVGQPEHCLSICKSAEGRVACRLDIAHTYYDAASADILVEDMRSAYDHCKLAPAPSFRRVIECIDKTPKSQRLTQWAELLSGARPCEFPTSSLPGQKAIDSHSDIPVLADRGPTVLEFCKDMHITHSTFFQVAWAIVLSHFTGQQDVCFGSLTSGRDVAVDGIETIIGPVATMLICRVNLQQTLPQVLKKTMENSIRHFSIQHTSLADIQHSLGLSGQRLFNTSLSIQGGRVHEATESRTLSMHACDGEDVHEHDLSLNVHVGPQSLDVSLAFRQPSISQQTAQEISTVLSQAVDFILEQSHMEATQPLFAEIFKHATGIEKEDAKAFWTSQFADTEGSHFPQVAKRMETPRESATCELVVGDLHAAAVGVSPGILVRAAWAFAAAKILGTSEALFGIVDSETPFTVPFRVSMDWTTQKASFLRRLASSVDAMVRYQRTGMRHIERFSDETAQGCSFQTLIQEIDDEHPLLPARSEISQKLPLILEFEVQSASELRLKMSYNHRIMEQPQAQRLLRQLRNVMVQLVNPSLDGTALADIKLVSEEDIRQIWAWNSTVPAAVNICFHNMISAQALDHPSSLALNAWDGNLTYAQLDGLSTLLAHKIISTGANVGDVIPISFEKSRWTTVAAVAVMKAGGTCLLVDPSTQPEDRIRALADYVGAKLVLTSSANEQMARRIRPTTIMVDELAFDEPLHTANQTLPKVSSSSPLYIMFTSGSTGTPKGIVVTNTNACSAIAYQGPALGFSGTTRTLDFASYAFDASWWNILLTLSAGGCLCVPSAAERDNVAQCIEDYAVTFVDLIPSVARHIEPRSTLSDLETLVLAGEPVLPSDSQLAGAATQIVNAYGPAECTPTATFSNMTQTGDFGIGRGAGLCTWVVESDNPERLAAIGAVGELYLEGPLVSDGYIGDPEKTAAAFIQDPAWLVNGAPGTNPGRTGRVYRTGDLVKYNAEGSLSFLGRKDSQVKVRGQRLELGEVEHNACKAIEESTGFKAQVVADVIKLRNAATKTLIAFVALEAADQSYSRIVLKALPSVLSRLEAALPVFMVPQHFIPLSSIPHTPSGKIDHRKLLAEAPMLIEQISSTARSGNPGSEKQPPETQTELLIQSLWANILRVPAADIGTGESFFRLGGDSVGAMQLVMKAKQKGLVTTVKDVFQNPVLGDLAALIDTAAQR